MGVGVWGCGGDVGMNEWMKCICPCFTPSRIVLTELVFLVRARDCGWFLRRKRDSAPHYNK